MTASWSARQEGTSERTWLRGIPWSDLGVIDIPAIAAKYAQIIVISPHPDDETLACGGLMADLVAAGGDVRVILVTDGEGSHPNSPPLTQQALRDVRAAELDNALRILGVTRDVVRLSFPDGGLAHLERSANSTEKTPDGSLSGHLQQAIHGAIRRFAIDLESSGVSPDKPLLVITPAENDGHADHDAVGRAVQALALPGRGDKQGGARPNSADAPNPNIDQNLDLTRGLSPEANEGRSGQRSHSDISRPIDIVSYPIWKWHWDTPQGFTWNMTELACPSAPALHAKSRAIQTFSSQISDFALPAETGGLLNPQILKRFYRLVETYFDPHGVLPLLTTGETVAATDFDAMFAESDDPWGVETRWYERRRRALIEACLPTENLGRTLDLGCSTGRLTQAIAERAESVLAVDVSRAALDIAQRRELADVTWKQAKLPDFLRDFAAQTDGDSTAIDPSLHQGGEKFDTVIISEIGYFLSGRALLELLSLVDGLLRPGGVVITVNWQHPTQKIPLDGQLVDRQVSHMWPTSAHYRDDDVVIRVSQPDHVTENSEVAT